MAKKRKPFRRGNIIAMPGSIERLLEAAIARQEEGVFDAAIDLYERAFFFREASGPEKLSYAAALLGDRRYREAKAVCEELLGEEPDLYFASVDLYIAACMELREFALIESLLSELLQEGSAPPEKIQAFRQLAQLSGKLSELGSPKADRKLEAALAPARFRALSNDAKRELLAAVAEEGFSAYETELLELLKSDEAQPADASLLLLALMEGGCEAVVDIQKFGLSASVSPAACLPPFMQPHVRDVLSANRHCNWQDPVREQMAEDMIKRHAFLLYPISWPAESAEEIADAYAAAVDRMLGKEVEEGPLAPFIRALEAADTRGKDGG